MAKYTNGVEMVGFSYILSVNTDKLKGRYNEFLRLTENSQKAPRWLLFMARHFGEYQTFGKVCPYEVRQFFGVQYMIGPVDDIPRFS